MHASMSQRRRYLRYKASTFLPQIRGERMTDREVIVEFVKGNQSEEDRDSSREAVSCWTHQSVSHQRQDGGSFVFSH